MGYTESEAKAFIEYIAPMIRDEATKRGYPICSTVIAQAIVEGAAGTSTLAKRYHNHFGMKAGTSWKGEVARLRTKEEYKKGVLTEIYANFRSYPNDEEGVKGYFNFIGYKRYENLKYAKDYRQFAEYLKKDGWATSSTYRDNLISKVEKYGLQKYDKDSNVRPTLRKGDRGGYVTDLQLALNKHGYNLKVDGRFGDNTLQAVMDYQECHGLKVDGIVGVKTWSELLK